MPRSRVLLLSGVLAACGAPEDVSRSAPVGTAPLAVTSANGVPFTFADGAEAKRQADARCGTGGVRTSIYDRFEAGAWVFVEGCA